MFTYDTVGQAWMPRAYNAPAFIAHIAIPVMGAGVMVFMDAPATYCWVS